MIGYKIVFDINNKHKRLLATLQIPEDALTNIGRTGLVDTKYAKHRCNKALVVSLENTTTEQQSEKSYTGVSAYWEKQLNYIVGEMVEISDFNPDLQNECTKGIHFFLDKQRALEYRLFGVRWTTLRKHLSLQLICEEQIPTQIPTPILTKVVDYYGDGSFKHELTLQGQTIVKLIDRHKFIDREQTTVYVQQDNIVVEINQVLA